ncbi:hypothetical protein E2C01_042834 [Portunus trituberculatus]|uniref:Uncharacterized protein n=1 Tax=Portunus trituberculatus TaxID=210409 RepID=A0A5B7FXK9_PORTR|nr:hypothetical protein [Portunus trituberculatus]
MHEAAGLMSKFVTPARGEGSKNKGPLRTEATATVPSPCLARCLLVAARRGKARHGEARLE